MADDDRPRFIGEELFEAATLFGGEVAENVGEMADAADVDVTHKHEHVHRLDAVDRADVAQIARVLETVDLDELVDVELPLGRLRWGAVAFFVLVALLALLAQVAVSVQVSVAMATVLVGDWLLARVRG